MKTIGFCKESRGIRDILSPLFCAARDALVFLIRPDQRTEDPARVLVKIGDHAMAFRGTPEALWLVTSGDRRELVIDEAGVGFRHYLEEYTAAPSKFRNRAEQRMFLKVLEEGLYQYHSPDGSHNRKPIVPIFSKNFRKKLRSGVYIGR